MMTFLRTRCFICAHRIFHELSLSKVAKKNSAAAEIDRCLQTCVVDATSDAIYEPVIQLYDLLQELFAKANEYAIIHQCLCVTSSDRHNQEIAKKMRENRRKLSDIFEQISTASLKIDALSPSGICICRTILQRNVRQCAMNFIEDISLRISEDTSRLESAGSASDAINEKCSSQKINSNIKVKGGQFVGSAIVGATATAGSLPLAVTGGDENNNVEDAENDLLPSPFCGALCSSKVTAMVPGKCKNTSMARKDAANVSALSTNDYTLLKYLRAIISSR